jgi:hypothetical protein
MSRHLWLHHSIAHAILEHIPDCQALHRNVLLMNVAVEWGAAGHFARHILDVVVRRLDHRPIGLAHADVVDVDHFIGAGVGKVQDCENLHAGFGKDFYFRGTFARSATVLLGNDAGVDLFQDIRLLRKILLGGGRILAGFHLGENRRRRDSSKQQSG